MGTCSSKKPLDVLYDRTIENLTQEINRKFEEIRSSNDRYNTACSIKRKRR